jgi:CRISPR-associated protein Csb1
MPVDLRPLEKKHRLLFAIPLEPLQGKRFQATGFPGLGAATFQTKDGQCLLVESAQSTANRLEKVVWDDATQDLVKDLKGLSHVRVVRGKTDEKDKTKRPFFTDTVLEAHRINSPYLLESSDPTFSGALKADLGGLEAGPIDRRKLAQTLLKYDVGSLLHGVFLAKKELAGGRLRVARALSAFIEADGVRTAPSGGVKNDHVNPSGDTKKGFGNVPFARDEFTADGITLYVNLDLAQIRGYGLGADVERLLILLALWKLRALLDGGLRLRTACDLRVANGNITANDSTFTLPSLDDLSAELGTAIKASKDKDSKPLMTITTVAYDDDLKKGSDDADDKADQADDEESGA